MYSLRNLGMAYAGLLGDKTSSSDQDLLPTISLYKLLPSDTRPAIFGLLATVDSAVLCTCVCVTMSDVIISCRIGRKGTVASCLLTGGLACLACALVLYSSEGEMNLFVNVNHVRHL